MAAKLPAPSPHSLSQGTLSLRPITRAIGDLNPLASVVENVFSFSVNRWNSGIGGIVGAEERVSHIPYRYKSLIAWISGNTEEAGANCCSDVLNM